MTIVRAVMDTAERILSAELGNDTGLCLVSLLPGDAAPMLYGQESCGGMAWVKADSVFPTTEFPVQSVDVNNCAATLAVQIEVGIMRPAPISDSWDGSTPPNAAQQNESARQQYADLDSIHAVMTKLAIDIEAADGQFILGRYVPVGIEAGVVGAGWQATVTMDP